MKEIEKKEITNTKELENLEELLNYWNEKIN